MYANQVLATLVPDVPTTWPPYYSATVQHSHETEQEQSKPCCFDMIVFQSRDLRAGCLFCRYNSNRRPKQSSCTLLHARALQDPAVFMFMAQVWGLQCWGWISSFPVSTEHFTAIKPTPYTHVTASETGGSLTATQPNQIRLNAFLNKAYQDAWKGPAAHRDHIVSFKVRLAVCG